MPSAEARAYTSAAVLLDRVTAQDLLRFPVTAVVRDYDPVPVGERPDLALEEASAHGPPVKQQDRLPGPLVAVAELGAVDRHSGHQASSPGPALGPRPGEPGAVDRLVLRDRAARSTRSARAGCRRRSGRRRARRARRRAPADPGAATWKTSIPAGVPREARKGILKSVCSPTVMSYMARFISDHRLRRAALVGLQAEGRRLGEPAEADGLVDDGLAADPVDVVGRETVEQLALHLGQGPRNHRRRGR